MKKHHERNQRLLAFPPWSEQSNLNQHIHNRSTTKPDNLNGGLVVYLRQFSDSFFNTESKQHYHYFASTASFLTFIPGKPGIPCGPAGQAAGH